MIVVSMSTTTLAGLRARALALPLPPLPPWQRRRCDAHATATPAEVHRPPPPTAELRRKGTSPAGVGMLRCRCCCSGHPLLAPSWAWFVSRAFPMSTAGRKAGQDGKLQDDKLLESVRQLLERGRPEVAIHLLQDECLQDPALRRVPAWLRLLLEGCDSSGCAAALAWQRSTCACPPACPLP